MPLEQNKENTNRGGHTEPQSVDPVRLARKEADKNTKNWLDAQPSFYEALHNPDYVNARRKGDKHQILEPVSTQDQLIKGSFDSIRLRNPALAEVLQTRWGADKTGDHPVNLSETKSIDERLSDLYRKQKKIRDEIENISKYKQENFEKISQYHTTTNSEDISPFQNYYDQVTKNDKREEELEKTLDIYT